MLSQFNSQAEPATAAEEAKGRMFNNLLDDSLLSADDDDQLLYGHDHESGKNSAEPKSRNIFGFRASAFQSS